MPKNLATFYFQCFSCLWVLNKNPLRWKLGLDFRYCQKIHIGLPPIEDLNQLPQSYHFEKKSHETTLLSMISSYFNRAVRLI
jgi:hypothetical protein